MEGYCVLYIAFYRCFPLLVMLESALRRHLCLQVFYGLWQEQEVAVKVLAGDAAQNAQMAKEVCSMLCLDHPLWL